MECEMIRRFIQQVKAWWESRHSEPEPITIDIGVHTWSIDTPPTFGLESKARSYFNYLYNPMTGELKPLGEHRNDERWDKELEDIIKGLE